MQQRIHYSLCVIIPPMWCGADFSFILASAKAVLYHQRNKLAANKATFCTCQKKKKHFGRLYLLYKMSHYRANCSTYTRRIISEITLFKQGVWGRRVFLYVCYQRGPFRVSGAAQASSEGSYCTLTFFLPQNIEFHFAE